MALKDWKKHKIGWGEGIGFDKGKLKHNKDLPKEQIMIEEYNKDWIVGKRTFSDYGFTKTNKTLKTFKTKTQAISYAKAYMKKH